MNRTNDRSSANLNVKSAEQPTKAIKGAALPRRWTRMISTASHSRKRASTHTSAFYTPTWMATSRSVCSEPGRIRASR